jgi:hypothetical protein
LTAVAGLAAEGPGVLVRLLSIPIYLAVMVRIVRPLLGSMVVARMRGDTINGAPWRSWVW